MNKTKFHYLLLSFLFLAASCNQDSPLNVSELTKISEDNVSVSKIALQLAKEFEQDLNLDSYESELDKMANEIRIRTKGKDDPRFRIRILSSYIKEKGFRYDYEDAGARKQSNRSLSGLLETKKGSCITFPLLYVVLGQRLGYPIYPVLIPEHYIVRYVDERLTHQNIETTSAAVEVPDSLYIKDFNITETGLKSGAYLKTLSYKEYIGDLIALNALTHWKEKRDFSKALSYINTAISFRQNTPELHRLKGAMLFTQSKIEPNPSLAMSYLREANQLGLVARELGFVQLPREEYEKSLKAKSASTN